MNARWTATRRSRIAVSTIAALALVLAGCNGDGDSDDGAAPLTVPKAACGANDKPETGLQGQVPAALRASGFQGFNCNLTLIGQNKGIPYGGRASGPNKSMSKCDEYARKSRRQSTRRVPLCRL